MKKLMMIFMAVALIALPTMAQEWESTSSMQGSGSAYSAQVTAVGATQAADMGTTTSANQAPGRPGQIRKGFDTGGDTQPGPSPIGDAVLPLAFMALAFAGVIYFRKRRARA